MSSTLSSGTWPRVVVMILRTGIERLDDGRNLLCLVVADEIELVEHDDIGELDLVDEQIGHRPFILFAQATHRGR